MNNSLLCLLKMTSFHPTEQGQIMIESISTHCFTTVFNNIYKVINTNTDIVYLSSLLTGGGQKRAKSRLIYEVGTEADLEGVQ